ncbi:membrane protein [Microbacterium phage Cece]|nr:membrane protein [Microbacterium phage Cece]UVG35329.1 membrane protein [Microbacterium phage Cece]
MPVQFVNAETGEVLPDEEVRKIVAPAPTAPTKPEAYRMPRGLFWTLIVCAIVVSNFLGFFAGAMSSQIDREHMRADNAVMQLQIERGLPDIREMRGARP